MRPMLPTAGEMPHGPGWAYELRWDGVRALVDLGPDVPGRVRVTGQLGGDVTVAFPELHPLVGAVADALLDGEIVSLAEGVPAAAPARDRMRVRDPALARRLAAQRPVTYLAFDILRLYGVDLRARPYAERRATLERLRLSGPHWTVPPAFDDGEATVAAAREHGLQGVVAKRLDSPYRAGERSADWRTVRLRREQELAVGGWMWGDGERASSIGALLVGYHDGVELRYAGLVAAGFTTPVLRDLLVRLAVLRRPTPPFAGPPPDVPADAVVWCEPEVVATVAFSSWDPEGRVRHATFRGLRADATPQAVGRG
jgi:bifunctional non-homologous end joining protein LigD